MIAGHGGFVLGSVIKNCVRRQGQFDNPLNAPVCRSKDRSRVLNAVYERVIGRRFLDLDVDLIYRRSLQTRDNSHKN